jgi:hypothetical protein
MAENRGDLLRRKDSLERRCRLMTRGVERVHAPPPGPQRSASVAHQLAAGFLSTEILASGMPGPAAPRHPSDGPTIRGGEFRDVESRLGTQTATVRRLEPLADQKPRPASNLDDLGRAPLARAKTSYESGHQEIARVPGSLRCIASRKMAAEAPVIIDGDAAELTRGGSRR